MTGPAAIALSRHWGAFTGLFNGVSCPLFVGSGSTCLFLGLVLLLPGFRSTGFLLLKGSSSSSLILPSWGFAPRGGGKCTSHDGGCETHSLPWDLPPLQHALQLTQTRQKEMTRSPTKKPVKSYGTMPSPVSTRVKNILSLNKTTTAERQTPSVPPPALSPLLKPRFRKARTSCRWPPRRPVEVLVVFPALHILLEGGTGRRPRCL